MEAGGGEVSGILLSIRQLGSELSESLRRLLIITGVLSELIVVTMIVP